MLAAVASGLVHLVLWGGLTTTRLTLLGSRPQDATAPKPAFRPKPVADFPLQVPKSPASKPAHERPLDMHGTPRQSQDMPRPETLRSQPPVATPALPTELPLPIAVTPPRFERPTALRDVLPDRVAENASAPERQRPSATAAPAAATADRLAAVPGQDSAVVAPKPAAPTRRPAEQESAGVTRRRPREVAMAAPTVPVTPPLSPRVSAAARDDSRPSRPPAPAPASRRAIVNPSDTAAATLETIIAPSPAPAVADSTSTSATVAPRPQSTTAGVSATRAEDRGRWAAVRGPVTPREAAADGAADPAAAGEPAGGPLAAAALTVTRMRTGSGHGGAGETAASASLDGVGGGAASASPPARSSLAGGTGTSTGQASTVPALPGAGTITSANAGSTTITPTPQTVSRLGDRSAAARRQTIAAATDGVEAADAADAEQLSSISEAGIVSGALVARERGDAPGAAPAPQPLDRVAAVTLPIEGRVREIAMPFVRRSRANRAVPGVERDASEVVVREKTRVAADAMIDRGLEFLARSQQPDGRWRLGTFPGSTAADTPRLSCDTAATGLAILSFLGAGHDHFGGRHRDTVRRGLEFLLAVQKPDGDLYLRADTLSDSCAWLYSHGIATMALCEAVGMTGDPLVKPAAARACDFIIASQHAARGGWRYTPRSDADLSVSGWMLVALRSGRLAGVEVDARSFDGVKTLLDASAITGATARYHYNPRNPQQRPSQLSAGCMTAVGTLMRLHTGWNASDPRVQQSARVLAALRPAYGSVKEKTRDCYLWYYASQVLVHTGGDEWTGWYDQLADTLERTQERQGPRAGSWDPLGDVPDRWGQYGGRIYVTALHLLALEVPDRRLPTYGSPEEASER